MRSPAEGSLAAAARGPDRCLGWLTLLAGLLLVAGWTLPLMTVERLLFLSREISILGGIAELWAEDKRFLATVIAVFSVVLPTVKLGLVLTLWNLIFDLNKAAKDCVEAIGCSIPFPQRDLHLVGAGGLAVVPSGAGTGVPGA